jgi:polyhydroxyalkanoate synthesis regulator phasin
MAAPDNGQRHLIEQLVLAGLGAASLTKERIDQLADSMAERGGVGRDEARTAINDVTDRWRSGVNLQGILRDLGLVLRAEYDELELRVAQLEHRLKLVEGAVDSTILPPVD